MLDQQILNIHNKFTLQTGDLAHGLNAIASWFSACWDLLVCVV